MADNKPVFRTTIGGQALMEGILMKGPDRVAVALRDKDGSISLRVEQGNSLKDRYPIFQYPFFRGIGALIDSLKMGMRALDDSAEALGEEESPGKFETWLGKRIGKEKAERVVYTFIFVVAFGIAIGLFFLLPTLISGFFASQISSPFLLNLLEGGVRLLLFTGYILAIQRMEELDRVFRYHGAEHKTIACYEHGDALLVENVKKYPIVHPRCGTSFIANLVILAAFFMSFFGWPNPLVRFALRLLLIPILIGVTYELNRFSGRSDHFLARLIRAPGMFVQKIATVKEPDEGMIECAICALQAVIPEEGCDKW